MIFKNYLLPIYFSKKWFSVYIKNFYKCHLVYIKNFYKCSNTFVNNSMWLLLWHNLRRSDAKCNDATDDEYFDWINKKIKFNNLKILKNEWLFLVRQPIWALQIHNRTLHLMLRNCPLIKIKIQQHFSIITLLHSALFLDKRSRFYLPCRSTIARSRNTYLWRFTCYNSSRIICTIRFRWSRDSPILSAQ